MNTKPRPHFCLASRDRKGAEGSGTAPAPLRSRLAIILVALAWLACGQAFCDSPAAPVVTVPDPTGAAGRVEAPVSCSVNLPEDLRQAAREGRLCAQEKRGGETPGRPVAVQLGTPVDKAGHVPLCWLLPPGPPGRRTFVLKVRPEPDPELLKAQRSADKSGCMLSESGSRILVYKDQTVEPGEVLKTIAPGSLKYARPRSDYIHPLFGLDGEELTRDWSVDHPHHRGIYWAWPEVDWHGQRGDLHALQQIFARPAGPCTLHSGPVFAEIRADNLWLWEDRTPIVRERALLRAYRATSQGRLIDVVFEFAALGDDVAVARRGTKAYGGLNIRCSSVQDQKIVTHTDEPGNKPRMTWSELSGIFNGGKRAAGLVVLQHQANPHYPGDWVQYPQLNWVQPTFPAALTRHVISKSQPLLLRYRLWIHRGSAAPEARCRDQWLAYHLAGLSFPESLSPGEP